MFSICIYAYECIKNNAIIYPKALGYILYYIKLYYIMLYNISLYYIIGGLFLLMCFTERLFTVERE